MDRQQIGLKLTVDEMGLEFNLATFSNRLILQKAVYLAQAAGVDLGYSFNWYLRGPYSPGLTRDAFEILSEMGPGADEEIREWSLDPASRRRLGEIRGLIPAGPEDEQARKLELLASVHHVANIPWQNTTDPQKLQEGLQRSGKTYSVDQVDRALSALRAHRLLRE